ncbi:Transmembrane protein 104 [Nymphon striatum]|nr:Transmembrane protein 104 [Nymphon striatum]
MAYRPRCPTCGGDHDPQDNCTATPSCFHCVGLVYIFNLIVGTGALTMPAAFNNAGWLLSLIIVCLLALMSYLTTTFVIESMASANAIIHWRTLQKLKKVNKIEEMGTLGLESEVEGSVRDEDIAKSLDSGERTPLLDDDAALTSSSEEGLVKKPSDACKEFSLNISITKTQVMAQDVSSTPHICVGNHALEVVDQCLSWLQESFSPLPEYHKIDYYDITERTEMGLMAKLFFNKKSYKNKSAPIDLVKYLTDIFRSVLSAFYNPVEVTELKGATVTSILTKTSHILHTAIYVAYDPDESAVQKEKFQNAWNEFKSSPSAPVILTIKILEVIDSHFLKDYSHWMWLHAKLGVVLFYICIIIYLYGDLAIYAAAISKSLRDVSCTYKLQGNSCGIQLNETDQCFNSDSSFSRMDMYRVFVAIFLVVLGPFVFFNLQKTKYMQIITSIMRWLAFTVMIVLVSIRLSEGKGRGHPKIASLESVPNLFGVCVYSFMCHHSLPSMVTPINKKNKLFSLIAADYVLILVFYCLLSFTGIFAFEKLEDLYTLNFQPTTCNNSDSITNIAVIQYFLALFPVFTLSSNFPIIGITLRNNLKSLFHREKRPYPWIIDRIFFPLLAIVPPVLISSCYKQKETNLALGLGVKNKLSSPFRHTFWVIFVLVWSVACLAFVTVNHIAT